MDFEFWEMNRCPDTLSSCLTFDNRETEKMVDRMKSLTIQDSRAEFKAKKMNKTKA